MDSETAEEIKRHVTEGLRELRRLFENRRLMDISEFGDLPLQLDLKRTDYGSTGRS